VAGFLLECVAGFIGIRSEAQGRPLTAIADAMCNGHRISRKSVAGTLKASQPRDA
jgi:hypothetical protein